MKRSNLPILFLLLAFQLSAGSVTNTPREYVSCLPFGCGPVWALTNYYQIYSASDFSSAGAVDISSLSFFSATDPGGMLGQGSYDIYLSSTSMEYFGQPWEVWDRTFFAHVDFSKYDGVSQMSTNGVNSLPASCGFDPVWPWWDTICDHIPQTLTIQGNSTFHYDPGTGRNLLMDIVMSGPYSGNGLFMWGNMKTGGFSGAMYQRGDSTGGTYGLLTEFTYDAAVPEPGTWVLLGGALSVLAGVRRRR